MKTWRQKPYAPFFGMLEVTFQRAWCRETASPECQDDWSPENPAYGQCAVTTAALYEILTADGPCAGLRIMRSEVEGFGSHYWLKLPDGADVDLTACQFPPGTGIPAGEERSIGYLLDSDRAEQACTRERMDLLIERFEEVIEEAGQAMKDMGLML